MKIVYSEAHRRHSPKGDVHGGRLVTPFDRPARMDHILRELKKRRMSDFVEPAVGVNTVSGLEGFLDG